MTHRLDVHLVARMVIDPDWLLLWARVTDEEADMIDGRGRPPVSKQDILDTEAWLRKFWEATT